MTPTEDCHSILETLRKHHCLSHAQIARNTQLEYDAVDDALDYLLHKGTITCEVDTNTGVIVYFLPYSDK